MRNAIVLTALTFLACAAAAPPPEEAKPVQPGPDFSELITDLGSPDFKIREAASSGLEKAGEAARPALLKAAGSQDPEVRMRAVAALQRLDAAAEAAKSGKARAEAPEPDPQAVDPPQVRIVIGGKVRVIQGGGVVGGGMINPNQPARLQPVAEPVQRLGADFDVCPEELLGHLGIAKGVLVREAKEGIALRKFDVILSVGGKEVGSPEELKALVDAAPKEGLEIQLLRKGEKVKVAAGAPATVPAPAP